MQLREVYRADGRLTGVMQVEWVVIEDGRSAPPGRRRRRRNEQLPGPVAVLLLRLRGGSARRVLGHQLSARAVHLPHFSRPGIAPHAPAIGVICVSGRLGGVELRRSDPSLGVICARARARVVVEGELTRRVVVQREARGLRGDYSTRRP